MQGNISQTSFQENQIVILETISEGSRTRIFKARMGTKFVALKAGIADDSMTWSLLKREYELGRGLSHFCIASTQEFLEKSPIGPAIVMEYVDGTTLEEYLERSLSRRERHALLHDILDGVDYLHHRGVLHNDIKPENIIVNANGAARIIDFGLSVSDDSAYKGVVGGSPGFTAPEILRGEGPSGAASDIYSLGYIVGMLLGSSGYGRIAERCCKAEPEERYSTVRDLRRAILKRRLLPVLSVAVSALVTVFLVAALPLVRTVREQIGQKKSREIHAVVLDSLYNDAIDSITCRRNQAEASYDRGIYMLKYLEYHDALPEGERYSCELIFAGHMRVLDSLMLSLPPATSD